MKHQLHVPFPKRLLQSSSVTYIANDRRKFALRIPIPELLFNAVQAVLIALIHDQHSRFERRYLAAQFRADGTPGPRDQDTLAFDNAAQPRRVQSHGPAAKQVLQRNAAHVAHPHPPVQHARQARENFYRQAKRLEHPHDAADRLRSHPRHRNQHLLGGVPGDDRRHFGPRTEHANATNHPPDLHAIVINEPDRAVTVIRIVHHVADDQLSGVAGAKDEHASARLATAPVIQDPPKRARPTKERNYHDSIDGVDGSRYPGTIDRKRHEGREQQRPDDCCGRQINQIPQTGVAPDSMMHSEGECNQKPRRQQPRYSLEVRS